MYGSGTYREALMGNTWMEAARRYARLRKDVDITEDKIPAIIAVARELMRFHRSIEALDAMLLLELAGGVISFGKGKGKMAEEALFCWSSRGPSKVLLGGLGALVGQGEPLPASFIDCAKAIVRGGISAEDFPHWFKAKLDEVAAKAPTSLEV